MIGGGVTVENAATLSFTGDNITVGGAGSTTATISVDRPTFNIEDGGNPVGSDVALETINFTDNLTATVSGSELTVSAVGGSGGGSGTVNQVDSISNPTQIISAVILLEKLRVCTGSVPLTDVSLF